MIASGISGLNISPSPALKPEVAQVGALSKNQNSVDSVSEVNKKTGAIQSMTIEEYVRGYFSDIPVMIEVARCESRFRQHNSSGEVLRGEQNDQDRGVMQINEYYHDYDSEKLGYDILTIEGNTAYARHLYEKYGLSPWKSSSKCWSKSEAYANYLENQLALK